MMEWRVFLPQINEETDGWVPLELRRQYEERVQLLMQSFPMSVQETRVDRYLVGYQHFGIKYRVTSSYMYNKNYQFNYIFSVNIAV